MSTDEYPKERTVTTIPQTVRVGDADVRRLGLGTNRLRDTPANADFLHAAARAGVGMVDTAHIYTGGESERTIGAALPASRAPLVATKGGYVPGDGRAEVLRAQIDESLRRLGTETIALYYLHRVDPQTRLELSLGVLAEYRDTGKIRNVGISAVTVDQVEQARKVVPIAAVQNAYNVGDRSHDEVVDYCTVNGIAFVPYHPLRGQHPQLATIARVHTATTTQISLAWLLHRSPMILPIPGSLSIDHVRENLGALDIALSEDEFQTLAAL